MSIASIKTKKQGLDITVLHLDKKSIKTNTDIDISGWNKLIIPCNRADIVDITVDGESIKHGLNAGVSTNNGYEIWVHDNLADYFSRISECIAQDDLIRFKDLGRKYLITESWNETVQGDFIPNHVKKFFANGEGPHWYHKDDFYNLPYVEYEGLEVDKDLNLDDDLTFLDSKFYGEGQCKSLKRQPVLPTISVDAIKNTKLKDTMQKFGFTDILQMQYVELQPNSVIPVHKDDFTYEDGKDLIDGPTQLYFVLSGSMDNIKFKFKNVGLLDVTKPVFINNHRFVHSLVYTGAEPRGVLLAYGVSSFTNKKILS